MEQVLSEGRRRRPVLKCLRQGSWVRVWLWRLVQFRRSALRPITEVAKLAVYFEDQQRPLAAYFEDHLRAAVIAGVFWGSAKCRRPAAVRFEDQLDANVHWRCILRIIYMMTLYFDAFAQNYNWLRKVSYFSSKNRDRAKSHWLRILRISYMMNLHFGAFGQKLPLLAKRFIF